MKALARGIAAAVTGLMLAGCAATGPAVIGEPLTSFIPIGSETIFSVRYEPDTGDLTVVLRNGDVLDFEKIPPERFEGLMDAEDRDAYFRERIEAEFESRKMEF